MTNFLP